MGRAWRNLLEVDCFVGVEFAVLYGVLCLVAANGDFAYLAEIANDGWDRPYEDPHLRREI